MAEYKTPIIAWIVFQHQSFANGSTAAAAAVAVAAAEHKRIVTA